MEATCQDQCVGVLKNLTHLCTEQTFLHEGTGEKTDVAHQYKLVLSHCQGQKVVSSAPSRPPPVGTSGTRGRFGACFCGSHHVWPWLRCPCRRDGVMPHRKF